ncbi:unnamed protein product [Aphanomyces euteiches]
MDERRTLSMERLPRKDDAAVTTPTATISPSSPKTMSSQEDPQPKSVMSSPNLTALLAKRDAFKLPKMFKDNKSTEERMAETTTTLMTATLTGTLSMYMRPTDKKKLFYVKTKYRVVAHTDKPTIELYTHESKEKIPAYMLSLCRATLALDPKDTEHGFSLSVTTWTKHKTINYEPHVFVFHEDKPEKLKAWITCLTHAIEVAVQYDDGGNIFRTSLGDDDLLLSDDDVSRISHSSSSDDEEDAVTRTLRKLNPFSPKSTTSPRRVSHNERQWSPRGQGRRTAVDEATATSPVPPRDKELEDDVVALPPPVIKPECKQSMLVVSAMALADLVMTHGGLALSFLSGYFQASVVCPLAVAGVYAHISTNGQDSRPQDCPIYVALVLSYLLVHGMAACGLVSGIVMVALVRLANYHVDQKTTQRAETRAEYKRVIAAEKDLFAHTSLHVNAKLDQVFRYILHPSRSHRATDFERTEWLNAAIARSWPFVKVAIRNSVMYYVNPMLETNLPAMVTSMELTSLEMGELAPSFGGVKCISPVSDSVAGEIAFDAHVRFMAGESQLAELKIVTAMGTTARVRLRDAVIAGVLRITLRPMSSYWPGFSGIALSFVTSTSRTFPLRPTGALTVPSFLPHDMNATSRLQTFIQDMVTNQLVWPRVLEVPFWDPALFPVEGVEDYPSTAANAASRRGYDEKKSVFGPGVVSLHVRHLVAPDLNASALYCVFTMLQTHKTELRVVDDHGTCAFDEKYEFYWDNVAPPSLQVQVWRHETNVPDQVLGAVTIPLGPLAPKRDHERKVDMDFVDEVHASLHIHVCRRLFSTVSPRSQPGAGPPKKPLIQGLGHDVCVGMLFVTLHEMSIPAAADKDDGGSRVIYGVLTCEKQRAASTSQSKRQSMTKWHELFSFFVYAVETASFTCEVFEKDAKGVESVGSVSLPVVEIRKQLAMQQSFTETFVLQKLAVDAKASVTLMFQWRHLMSA